MKRILAIFVTLVALAFTSEAQNIISTNVTGAGVYILSTNRASIYQIELSGSVPCVVTFYDSDTLAAPYYGTNYVSGAYAYRTSWSTNLITSYISSNGYTNTITNVGIFTASVTNAANTNALQSLGSFVVAGNTYAVYNVDQLHARGISIRTTTNVSVVINYRTGQ